MSKQDDGGPAFPVELGGPEGHQTSASTWQYRGMSMRDAFAIAAMQGICAHADTWGLGSSEQVAIKAYVLADEMLEARQS